MIIAYRLLTAAILGSVVALGIVTLLTQERGDVLPVQFRIDETDFSDLPVVISDLKSCSCWIGPRYQAERKFKFHVSNHTDELLNIGGGERSVFRLIVAYPRRSVPSLTLPKTNDDDVSRQLESPPDRPVRIAHESRRVRPSEVLDSHRKLAVPPGHRVWALPPNPNWVAEDLGDDAATYPTSVDRSELLPGEGYGSDRLGHGTWTFSVPISPDFAGEIGAASEEQGGGFELVLSRDRYEREVVFVGIAAFRVAVDGSVDMIGFAPAPSDDALAHPSEL